ncbi:hypothetical protein PR048_008855 [Dryococelus australis]|uniref:Uncharacterized protein n=1 Tax=Dryococelus australis TaxID=614101 RepID=A0ABQ9HZ36_9NEOP|nr:hypothetical protein PR048_008855 [Dryococelus australis]
MPLFGGFSRRSPVSTVLAYRRCSVLASVSPLSALKSQDFVVYARLLASRPGSIPGRVTGFSHMGIVPDDAVDWWVFSGISRFPHLFIPAPLHPHRPQSPSSALKTTLLRAAQISSLTLCLLQTILWRLQKQEYPEKTHSTSATLIDLSNQDLTPARNRTRLAKVGGKVGGCGAGLAKTGPHGASRHHSGVTHTDRSPHGPPPIHYVTLRREKLVWCGWPQHNSQRSRPQGETTLQHARRHILASPACCSIRLPCQISLATSFHGSRSRNFACGNRCGRCRWSVGFLGNVQFPPPLHSGAASYSPRFTHIGPRHLEPSRHLHSPTTYTMDFYQQRGTVREKKHGHLSRVTRRGWGIVGGGL